MTLETKPHVTSRVKQAELINRFMKVLSESVKISGYISKRSIKKIILSNTRDLLNSSSV